MTFKIFLEIPNKIYRDKDLYAWDEDGKAWVINRQLVEDGGDAKFVSALNRTFQCTSCKNFGWAGEVCDCGEQLPPAWLRMEHLDHPNKVGQ